MDLSACALIGEGTIRCCYRIPGTGYCLKFYASHTARDPVHPRTFKTRLRLWLTRHTFWFNINMQEWRYYQRLKKRLPTELFRAFPEEMEPVYSSRYGWGVKETLILNDDGSYVRLVSDEIKRLADDPKAVELYEATERFFEQMIKHAVAIYDPRNILVQWKSPSHFVLRMVDFEPRAKAVIPGLSYLPFFVRYRVRTRSQRYLAGLRKKISKLSSL